jgi:hypothetical protein
MLCLAQTAGYGLNYLLPTGVQSFLVDNPHERVPATELELGRLLGLTQKSISFSESTFGSVPCASILSHLLRYNKTD